MEDIRKLLYTMGARMEDMNEEMNTNWCILPRMIWNMYLIYVCVCIGANWQVICL